MFEVRRQIFVIFRQTFVFCRILKTLLLFHKLLLVHLHSSFLLSFISSVLIVLETSWTPVPFLLESSLIIGVNETLTDSFGPGPEFSLCSFSCGFLNASRHESSVDPAVIKRTVKVLNSIFPIGFSL